MASVFVMSSPASFCYPAMFHNDDLFLYTNDTRIQ